MGWPHLGHLALKPAKLSGARILLLQEGQMTAMGMTEALKNEGTEHGTAIEKFSHPRVPI